MKATLLVAAVLVGLFVFQWLRRRPRRAEAHRLVEAGARLVDVRTRAEFAAGHLPGAVNIPVDELPGRLKELGSKKKPLVVYCRSGARSGRAERFLRQSGYEHIVNLGPMSAW